MFVNFAIFQLSVYFVNVWSCVYNCYGILILDNCVLTFL